MSHLSEEEKLAQRKRRMESLQHRDVVRSGLHVYRTKYPLVKKLWDGVFQQMQARYLGDTESLRAERNLVIEHLNASRAAENRIDPNSIRTFDDEMAYIRNYDRWLRRLAFNEIERKILVSEGDREDVHLAELSCTQIYEILKSMYPIKAWGDIRGPGSITAAVLATHNARVHKCLDNIDAALYNLEIICLRACRRFAHKVIKVCLVPLPNSLPNIANVHRDYDGLYQRIQERYDTLNNWYGYERSLRREEERLARMEE